MDKILQWDEELFLLINGFHNSFGDFIMFWMSEKFIWIPLYLFFVYLIYRQYKLKTLIVLIFVAIMITFSDQISVHLFKNIFQRLRPCHDPGLMDLFHIVKDKCGGQYGFISSHAANTFAISVFLIKLIGRKYKYFTILIMVWAILISYSRIYLGVHFPGDVIIGAFFGAFLGWFFNWLLFRFLFIFAKS
ncbi:MAG: phosphatase PAP2 family protein [Bacteroidales bacterium]|nr:phosphatase PAP2 family protein [Bacteroidales bacterium]